MKDRKSLAFTTDVLLYPLIFVMLIWLVFWAESRFGLRFHKWGIYPQKVQGLRGILFGPFIHGSLKHIFNNSIPLFVLSMALFYFYRHVSWKVLLWGTLLTGLLTWSFARPANHIGASGVVYLLAAFLFFKGIFSKQYKLMALSMAVVFVYGSMLWYLFPVDPKISWEGHLSGFIVGIGFALIFKKNSVEDPKYAWEQEDFNPEDDPFLKHFDEDGNFIESVPEELETLEVPQDTPPSVTITYTLTTKPKDDTTK